MIESHPPPPRKLSPIDPRSSTLLVKPGSLGDVIHALPVAAALHHAWPQGRLSWVIDPRWEPILAGNPSITERIPFAREKYRGPAGLFRAARWLGDLRHHRPDLVIDLQGLLRSAVIARASLGRRVVGLSDAREGAGLFYSEAAPVAATQHAVDRYLSVLPLLGLAPPVTPEFPLPIGDPLPIVLPADYILLHPYARGAGKSLTAEQINGLCERLTPVPVVLAGIGTAPTSLPANTLDLTGKTTLAQLITLLRRARAVLSVDSGPMHLAAALGTRLLSIHTWSDPRKVGPYSRQAFVWQGGELRPQRLDHPPLPEKALTPRDLDAITAWTTTTA